MVWAITAALLGGACATPPPPRSVADERAGLSCALDVPSTRITTLDASDGAVIGFENLTEQVDTLRRRVKELARRHTEGARPTGSEVDIVPGATAIAEYVEDGALLRLSARGGRSLAGLRGDARALAARLRETPCSNDREDKQIPALPPTFLVL
jgi:hypothetical protein